MSLRNWQSGYCTNIHPGVDLRALQANFEVYSAKVRELVGCHDLGIGMWIPQDAANQLCERPVAEIAEGGDYCLPNCSELAVHLSTLQLRPYTINGFPYGNFHQPVVKHKVYLPTWGEIERQTYTEQLIYILHNLLPAEQVGSISTLPLGWGRLSPDFAVAAASRLRAVADRLRQLELETGRRIVVAIEPEPGCMLDTSEDVVRFFDQFFQSETDRRYLTVCHDICHAAVMNETQRSVLNRYAASGITVGKVQVSSAIEVPWAEMDDLTARGALEQLSQFAEDRYLHQTGVVDLEGNFCLHEDLPGLLAQTPGKPNDQCWRIHFHVPIFLERFGYLRATHQDVLDCLEALSQLSAEQRVAHMEVETYAWSVLPQSMRGTDLAESIAMEIRWLDRHIQSSDSL